MDFKDLESKLKLADASDVKATIESVKSDRLNKINKHCATRDLTSSKMGQIPTELYFHCLKKYGKEAVSTKKFWREFFDTMTVFNTRI